MPTVIRDNSEERKEMMDINRTSLKWTKLGVVTAILISVGSLAIAILAYSK